MIIQPTNISTLFNSILTNLTKGSLVYKTKPNLAPTGILQRFFELSLPQDINKADVEHILITTCKKPTLSTGKYFKLLIPQTEHIFLSPFFEDESLKIWIGNTDVNNENDLMAPYISKIKGEFKEKERETLIKIFDTEKNKPQKHYLVVDTRFELDDSLKMYSYFKTKYISNDLEAFRAEENIENLYRKIIDSLFTKELMKEELLKYAFLYSNSKKYFKNEDLTFTKDGETNTVPFDTWRNLYVNIVSESLTADHWVSIKDYLKNILNFDLIHYSVTTPIAEAFKCALESHYKAETDSLKIGKFNFDYIFESEPNYILHLLKMQYSYFYEVLKEVHCIARSTKEVAKAITYFNEPDIEKFKELLTTYQKASGDEAENIISHLIDTIKTKLNEAVESSDFKTKKSQLELFTVLNDEQKILQFTLILNESEYVYPRFYTFTGSALNPVEDVTEVEAYTIINRLGTKGREGPKGIIGLSEGFSGAVN